jgi:4-amino-4-deoxy-L-arabinose transferase-like glycosyltransferase
VQVPGSFAQRLAVVAAGGLALRVAAAVATNDHLVQGDAMVFHQVAQHLADGDGFRQAFRDGPTAEHPPGWEVVLAAANLVGGNGYLSHRLVGAVLGTVTVVLIGLLGRRVASPAVGLTAAAIAAAYPMLWGADVSLMSETLYGALLVAALLAATYRRPVVLGVLLALAALTRGEALLLLPLLVVPLFWRRWRELAIALVAFAAVLAPWTARNLATFDVPVLISSNANGIFAGSYCDDVFHGDLIGYWRFQCYSPERPGEDESEFFARQREQGVDYLQDHLGRLPAVLPVRLARLLDVWDTDQSVFINAQEGRAPRPVRWGIRMWWLLAPLAVAGAVLQWRRGRRDALLVLLAPVAMVIAVALATYGTTRFRFAAEPSVCVLAAVSLVALLRTLMTQFHVRSSRSPGTRVIAASRGQ